MTLRRSILIGLILLLTILNINACSNSSDQAVKTVESYLTALVSKNADKLASLSCKSWEEQARLEIDSFQAVSAKLEGMSCKISGQDGDSSLVQCQGKIIATYQNENQELSLANRTYRVKQEQGDWRVCGYK